MSDSDVELQEKSYLRTLLEDFDITTDGNSNIEDKDNHRYLTAKSGVDGVATMSLSGNVPTGNIQIKKDKCHPEMLSAKGRVGGVVTTSSSVNLLTANIDINSKKVADAGNEQVKKLMDTKKLAGSVTDKSRLQKDDFSDSDTMLREDDDFLVVATKVTPPQSVVFSPLTAEMQVEVGPLLNISQFSMPKVQIFGRGRLLKPFVHAQIMKIAGDDNCLFQAISYAISNSEQYHALVRREICNFIETYDKDLKPLMKKGQGKMYIEGSGM